MRSSRKSFSKKNSVTIPSKIQSTGVISNFQDTVSVDSMFDKSNDLINPSIEKLKEIFATGTEHSTAAS